MRLKVETENDTEKLKARQDGSICNPITEEAGEMSFGSRSARAQ